MRISDWSSDVCSSDLDGLIATIILSALTIVFGGLVGAALALARISPLQPVRIATGAYISFVQGIPLLVLMGLAFFGPSLLGFGHVGPLPAATLAMAIYASVYLVESSQIGKASCREMVCQYSYI